MGICEMKSGSSRLVMDACDDSVAARAGIVCGGMRYYTIVMCLFVCVCTGDNVQRCY